MMGKLEELLSQIHPDDAAEIRRFQELLRSRKAFREAKADPDIDASMLENLRIRYRDLILEADSE